MFLYPRRPADVLGIASLVLCLGLTVATIYSCFISMEIGRKQTVPLGTAGGMRASNVSLSLFCGRINFLNVTAWSNSRSLLVVEAPTWPMALRRDNDRLPLLEALMGFYSESCKSVARGGHVETMRIDFPTWPVMVGSGLLFAGIARRRRTEALRSREQVCVKCGYDLRATPHRCPECGTIPQNSTAVAGASGF